MEKGSRDSGGLGVKSRQISGMEVLFLFRGMDNWGERERKGEGMGRRLLSCVLYFLIAGLWIQDWVDIGDGRVL